MNKYGLVIIIIAIVFFSHGIGLEYKQRYNQNTDFLLHEAGGNPPPKRDYAVPQPNYGNNQNLNSAMKNSDFPPLGPPSSQQTTLKPHTSSQPTRSTQSTGKRDFVNPNYNQQPSSNIQPTVRPQTTLPASPQSTQASSNSGKRDYVNSNYPPLKPPANTQPPKNTQPTVRPQTSPQPTQIASTSGKRDYVNPNFPPLNVNSQPGSGKVKDLVNFYDGKSQPTNAPQRPPSYSSILQGPNGKPQGGNITPPTQKPTSFSSVVSGPNRPSNTITTSKPTNAPRNPANTGHMPTVRPNVLPSSVVNNNRNQGSSGSSPSDTELQTLSEELLRKDTNNAAKYITINYQGKVDFNSNEDKAPQPLLAVAPEAWNIPTIQKFVPLLDNYERDILVNEYVTPQERIEENDFMDAIMSTSVIRHLMNFFKEKGYVTPDPKQQRDFLKQLWFSLYSRGKGKLGSSGFEHTFVSELKNSEVSGLHNWVYFAREEQANRLNYLGYRKYEELGDKASIVKLRFTHEGAVKPSNSLLVGTSPELEMALYTLCFVTRVDQECKLKLSGKDVNVQTYKFRYRSKNFIGSAYPQF